MSDQCCVSCSKFLCEDPPGGRQEKDLELAKKRFGDCEIVLISTCYCPFHQVCALKYVADDNLKSSCVCPHKNSITSEPSSFLPYHEFSTFQIVDRLAKHVDAVRLADMAGLVEMRKLNVALLRQNEVLQWLLGVMGLILIVLGFMLYRVGGFCGWI